MSRRESERERERDREERRERDRDRDRDREREKDRDRHHRDRQGSRSSREDKGRDGEDSYDLHRSSRDFDRHRDYDRDAEKRLGHKSRSRSRERSRHRSRSKSRSRSRSRSRSKSKRASGFDVSPPGAAVLPGAPMLGQLPGVPQPIAGMFPNLFPFGTTQFGGLPLVPAQPMTQQATRHARKVYVGGLPAMANEQDFKVKQPEAFQFCHIHTIATFFSHVMALIGGNTAGPGDAVVNVYINHEKKFAFVEMRTVEEASNAMALDGIMFEGVSLRVRRPTDYKPSIDGELGPSQPSLHLNLAAVGLTPGAIGGAEGPDRIFVGGLPYYLTEAQIRELLESFGPLRGFVLVKDRDTGNSKGYAFCVYQDPSVTDIACAALNGLKMGEKTLTVRRATAGNGQTKPDQDIILQQAQQHIAYQKLVLQASGAALPGVGSVPGLGTEMPSKVICLSQVVTADELRDDNEYEEILEDMREEGGKFGELVNVVIPRPGPSGGTGVGKVFLEYADTLSSARAKAALNGRRFANNLVVAVYFPEDKFSSGEYDFDVGHASQQTVA